MDKEGVVPEVEEGDGGEEEERRALSQMILFTEDSNILSILLLF